MVETDFAADTQDYTLARQRLDDCRQAWADHVTPDVLDHTWLVVMASKGVASLANPDSATPSGDGGERSTRGEIEGLVDALIETARRRGSGALVGGDEADIALGIVEDQARTALLSRITSPSSITSGRDPSGPGSREPGPTVPASGFDPSRNPHDEIDFDTHGRPGRRKLATAVHYFMAQLRQSYFGEEHGTPAVLDGPTAAMPRGCWFDEESDRLLKALTPAPGGETRRAETAQAGSVHEHPIAESEAPASLSLTPPDLIQAAREAAESAALDIVDWMMTEGLARHRTPEDDALKIEDMIFRSLQTPHQGLEDGHRPGGHGLTLRALHAANIVRQAEWCPDQVPDLSFRGNELAGEVGEACNVVKKLERERHGWRGSRATLDDLAQELADVVICADLCAVTAGIDLDAAVVAKFNATSAKQGLTTMLPLPHPAPTTGGEAPGRDGGWRTYQNGDDPRPDVEWSGYLPDAAESGPAIAYADETGEPLFVVWWDDFGNGSSRITRWRDLPADLCASPRSSQKEEGV